MRSSEQRKFPQHGTLEVLTASKLLRRDPLLVVNLLFLLPGIRGAYGLANCIEPSVDHIFAYENKWNPIFGSIQ